MVGPRYVASIKKRNFSPIILIGRGSVLLQYLVGLFNVLLGFLTFKPEPTQMSVAKAIGRRQTRTYPSLTPFTCMSGSRSANGLTSVL